MIKLYLPDDFSSKQSIKSIYKKLSETISSKENLMNISYTYKGIRKQFDSVETIKRFLLATDFYEYKFENYTEFFRDFINLDSRVKISNILNNSSPSKNVQAFCNKYDRNNYQQYYMKLEKYNNCTIKQFIKESKDSELQQWKYICSIFDYDKLDRYLV